jgi:hypothetical protein
LPPESFAVGRQALAEDTARRREVRIQALPDDVELPVSAGGDVARALGKRSGRPELRPDRCRVVAKIFAKGSISFGSKPGPVHATMKLPSGAAAACGDT